MFFLINANQVGVGILNFQTNLVRSINNDGWIAILIAGASANLMIFLIYFLFKKHLLMNLVTLRNLCLVNGLDNSSIFSTFCIFVHCL
ncbi:GerAB/ArcD/ProY family transporter [Bacillus sp. B6(2022)]|nr:GerAB/ArcD/ProY family transporter [Bacillus sp. B6(2022)]